MSKALIRPRPIRAVRRDATRSPQLVNHPERGARGRERAGGRRRPSTADSRVCPYPDRAVDDHEGFDDPAEALPLGPSRARQIVLAVVASMLVVSMVFLAFVSGRGAVAPVRQQPEASLGVGGVSGPSAAAPGSVGAPRLAVVGSDGRLSTMDEFGANVVAYSSPGSRYGMPAWSPDGRSIAALATTDHDAAIHVFSVEGPPAAPTVVYASADDRPSYMLWTLDSHALTFLTTNSHRSAMQTVPLDQSTAASIVQVGSPIYWTWGTEGRALIHSGGDGPGAFLGQVSLADGTRERIASDPGGFRVPGRSGDGKWLAYATRHEDAYRIQVESIDGTTRRELPIDAAGALGFSPTTDDLAFVAPVDTDRSPTATATGQLVGPLWVVDSGSKILRRLIASSVVAFQWSPDGRTIAVLQLPTDDDRQALVGGAGAAGDPEAGDPAAVDRRVASIEHGIVDVVNGRGGIDAAPHAGVKLRLAFVRVEDGMVRSKSIVQVADSFANQIIPAFDQYALSHRIWASDSSMVALPVVASDGSVSIVEVRPDGSQPRKVADGVAAFWSP